MIRAAQAKFDLGVLEAAVEAFETDNGRYPTTEEGLSVLVNKPAALTTWHGPYIKQEVLLDPWKNKYIYRQPGKRNKESFDLYSLGSDGVEGGGDDVTNWDE